MSINTHIQWTNNTVNFWKGCHKISDGCKFCYMYRDAEWRGFNPMKIQRCTDETFYKALGWKKGIRIFTNSWSDFFIEEADAWRKDAWGVIRNTPQHEWQILTKRPHLIMDRLPQDWGNGWNQVILGVSVENQKVFHRVYELAQVPAKRRFLSIEPLLGEINILEEVNGERPIDKIDWIVIGGESGFETGSHRYRPCAIEWIEKIIYDLRDHAPHVRIFVKQLGTYQARILGLKDKHGGNLDEFPEEFSHLKIREYAPEMKSGQLVLFE